LGGAGIVKRLALGSEARARVSGAGGMKLIYFNKLNKGGHFAAWEQPALFTAEMRAAFRSFRQSI
jgi:hypothetical protein